MSNPISFLPHPDSCRKKHRQKRLVQSFVYYDLLACGDITNLIEFALTVKISRFGFLFFRQWIPDGIISVVLAVNKTLWHQ